VIQRSHTEKRLLEELNDLRPADSILSRCDDPERCARLYRGILVRAALTIERGAVIMEALLGDALQRVPSPERALVHLDRFLEASLSPSGILEHFLRAPRLLSDYLVLISASLWLADTMVRDAGLFRWLLASDVLEQTPSRVALFDAARGALRRFDRPETRYNALRRFQRRELLRIAAADVLGRKPFAQVVRELSALADAVVNCALEEAAATVARRRGRAGRGRIAVLALGKLGGSELNYSSDIDLMIVYDTAVAADELPSLAPKEETDRDITSEVHDEVIAVVKEMLRMLTESSSEGMLYRTDLRLRPDGAAGALALSLTATLAYYERRGALWERQMLLRARFCAGNGELGREVLQRIEPFVHPRTILRPPSQMRADVQSRLAERWRADTDVKHMRGGIRHIEFSLQTMQMLHGQQRGVRTPSTLESIAALATAGLLRPEEEALLRNAYVFLRRVEHVLQLERFEQTHTLPESATDLLRVAWVLGFDTVEAFRRRLQETRADVSRICDEILGGSSGSGEDDAFAVPPSLPDDVRTRALLHDLIYGRSSAPRRTGERHRLRELLPDLLRDVSATPLPAHGLAGVEHFIHAAGTSGGLTYLAHPRARQLLLRLAALAPAVLRQLERDPLALELVFSGWDGDILDAPRLQRVVSVSALASLLLDDQGMDACSRTLTGVADTLLLRALARLHDDSFPFAVLALGKYGSAELIPGSDLDVILLYEARAAEDHERAQRLARDLIREMQGGVIPALYEVDARLRPEGRNAPLAVTREAWERYLHERASLWERQSLLRARIAAGDSRLSEEIAGVVEKLRTGMRLTGTDVGTIRGMRAKMEPENRFRQHDFFDVKKSAGGLVDAEFAAQALQLALPQIRTGGTITVLTEAAAHVPGIAGALVRLREQYQFLRRVQLFLRLLIETPSNLFPQDDEQRMRLAAAMGFDTGSALIDHVRKGMLAARKDFEIVLDTVSSIVTATGAQAEP